MKPYQIPSAKRRKMPPILAVGAYSERGNIFCFFSSRAKNISLAESQNAEEFKLSGPAKLPIKNFRRVRISKLDIGRVAIIEGSRGGVTLTSSRDDSNWKTLCHSDKSLAGGVIVPQFQLNGQYLMFLGGKSIRMTWSHDGRVWVGNQISTIAIPRKPDQTVEIDCAETISRGILLCYRLVSSERKRIKHEVHLAILDSNAPERLLWHSPFPIWESKSKEWGNAVPVGAVVFRSQIFGFWNTQELGIVSVRYPVEGIPFELPRDISVSLMKARTNPIIYPRSQYPWEAFATYNPAAFLANGKIHILYRAQGSDLVSSIGYACSTNGEEIEERLEEPVFRPQEVFETLPEESETHERTTSEEGLKVYRSTSPYASGGGIAGCEDPRVTVMDDQIYMTYVAFDGATPPRVALTSINMDDFLAKRWLWQRPVLISPPGVVDKSAVIFPEKINGQYVIMHRIFPDILIDYEPDLNFDGSRWLKGEHRIQTRDNSWDSRKIGAGAPPIKTEEGWLLIYYGVDDRDDRFYKMGAMLLDLDDPTKVLYRSPHPILEPEDWYENSGFKPGIVYPCGAVLLGEKLLVYYGGADCVVCVASINLSKFLNALKSNHELQLSTDRVQQVKYHASNTF